MNSEYEKFLSKLNPKILWKGVKACTKLKRDVKAFNECNQLDSGFKRKQSWKTFSLKYFPQ